jgi:hypothetical protein
MAVNTDVPPLTQWVFNIFDPSNTSQAINSFAINDSGSTATVSPLVTFYNTLFFRDPQVGYLGALVPDLGMQATFAPDVSDITNNDYLMGVRIIEDTVGIYWVTGDQTSIAPQYFPVQEIDRAVITYDMPITRGHQGICTPQYTLRGGDPLDYSQVAAEIDGAAINDQAGYNSAITPNTYNDKYNTAVIIDRSGTVITHAQELS